MFSILLMITLRTAMPAGEFVKAGDTLRLTTARGRVEGSFLRTERGQPVLRDDLGETVRGSSAHGQRAEVARVVEGSGHGVRNAALAGLGTFVIGSAIALTASDEKSRYFDDERQFFSDREKEGLTWSRSF